MTRSFRYIISYFELVLHPAAGWSGSAEKPRRRMKKPGLSVITPDSSNIRGMGHKQIMRRSPAP